MKHPSNRPFKRIIQIRTNKRKWIPVEFLGFNNGKIKIRFFSGEIINRKCVRVRWYKPRRIIKQLRSYLDQNTRVDRDGKEDYKRQKQKRKKMKGKYKKAWKANEKTYQKGVR